jgi:glycine betaine/proline transport system ATP-binding protein
LPDIGMLLMAGRSHDIVGNGPATVSAQLPLSGVQAAKLQVESLAKIYGQREAAALEMLRSGVSRDDVHVRTRATIAVLDVSFVVQPGETFVVMGLSGSGKSTLIRCLNRLIEPTAGKIIIDQADICRFDAAALRELRVRKIAMVFQHVALLPHRTVVENVAFGLKIRGLASKQRRERAMAALEQVGLAKWASQRPAQLSGGMQQRVGLARALAVDPDILLMDEPFSALDPLIRSEMQEQLLHLQRNLKKTIVFITHDLHEALALGNRIAIMKDGRFVQVATPVEILGAPADDYVSAFTRDIDRARILTVTNVMRLPATVMLTESVAAARARLGFGVGSLYAVDELGRPVGIVTAAKLNAAAANSQLRQLLETSFPRARADARLVEIYAACAGGVSIAILDSADRIIGMVQPLDVFAALSTPTGKAATAR